MKKYFRDLLQETMCWPLLTAIYFLAPQFATCQTKGNTAAAGPAFATGKYRNLFLEAGYSKAGIDKKIDKAYYDLFEGTNPIYFRVGDSMAYVSDLKNHDARTEGLSYGMMIPVLKSKASIRSKISLTRMAQNLILFCRQVVSKNCDIQSDWWAPRQQRK